MALDRPTVIATLVGGIAVLLWSLLAFLTVEAGGIPPFQLLAMTFSIACVVSLVIILRRGLSGLAVLAQPWPVWAVGVGGLFGYHAVYFYALGNAPAIKAQLIAYLWPVLIVVFATFLPGRRSRWFHWLGALVGAGGATLLILGTDFSFPAEYWPGYVAALTCAVIWATYSTLNGRFGQVPTGVVSGFCGVVAILGYFFHLTFERTVVPEGAQWLAVLGLGLGPVGLAFFVWDYGTKHGSLPVLGVLSYAAPLLSTLIMIAAGHGELTREIAFGCVLVVGGALIASKEMLLRRKPAAPPVEASEAKEPVP